MQQKKQHRGQLDDSFMFEIIILDLLKPAIDGATVLKDVALSA